MIIGGSQGAKFLIKIFITLFLNYLKSKLKNYSSNKCKKY